METEFIPATTIIRTVAALSMGPSARYELVRANTDRGQPMRWRLVGYGITGIRYILATSTEKATPRTKSYSFTATAHGMVEGLALTWTMRPCDME